MNKYVMIYFMCILCWLFYANISYADAPASGIFSAGDATLYEAQRNQAIAIGSQIDAVISNSDASLATGNDSGPHAIADTLNAAYYLRALWVYSDEDIELILTGTDINPVDLSDAVTVSITGLTYWVLEMTNINTVEFSNDSGSTASIKWWITAMKKK